MKLNFCSFFHALCLMKMTSHCQQKLPKWTSLQTWGRSQITWNISKVSQKTLFSFVLAFSTFIKRTKIFVFHSSFIRKNGKKCPSLREKSFCFSKSFFPTLKEKSFCLAKAFFPLQKDFRVAHFLTKISKIWNSYKKQQIHNL